MRPTRRMNLSKYRTLWLIVQYTFLFVHFKATTELPFTDRCTFLCIHTPLHEVMRRKLETWQIFDLLKKQHMATGKMGCFTGFYKNSRLEAGLEIKSGHLAIAMGAFLNCYNTSQNVSSWQLWPQCPFHYSNQTPVHAILGSDYVICRETKQKNTTLFKRIGFLPRVIMPAQKRAIKKKQEALHNLLMCKT